MMNIYTDSVDYAARLVPSASGWAPAATPPSFTDVAGPCFGGRRVHAARMHDFSWPALLIVESTTGSQFDLLVECGRRGADLPDGVLCVAGHGTGLHGLRGRPWTALDGNIHLSMWLRPPAGTVPSATRFLAMAAVSVVEVIDGLPGLADRAGIKWVNDILVDGAKVCGILTHVPKEGIAVIGIGLNVETVPSVPATPFVPRSAALQPMGAGPDACALGAVFTALLRALARNYGRLVSGGFGDLLAAYRRRSLVVGRTVRLYREGDTHAEVLAEGRVARVGDELELYLEGVDRPFTTGRVVLGEH